MRSPRPFWSLVDKSAGPDACWPWLGRRDPQGYGVYDADGKAYRAHRYALGLDTFSAALPVARHRCDNAPCCNPAHLEAGTVADNNRDMLERGRRPLKVTVEQLDAIRAACAGGGRGIYTRVAREYGVTPQYVGRIVRQAVVS